MNKLNSIIKGAEERFGELEERTTNLKEQREIN